MSESIDVFLGFDPGGEGHFGWSICRVNNGQFRELYSGVENYAQAVVNQVKCHLPKNAQVRAAGIDAPLFWTRTGQPREVDGIIRGVVVALGLSTRSSTVQQVNSLMGACLVQGVLLARTLWREFDNIPITETHPKALRFLLKRRADLELPAVLQRIGTESNHQQDARTSAYAARAMYNRTEGWRDLYREPTSINPFDTPVSYWMPIPEQPPQ